MSDVDIAQKVPEVAWWEKHVEYTFVLNASRKCNLDFLSPLAGPAETISDAIVGNNSKYFIIEFKRTIEHFKDEYKKFLNGKVGTEEASAALSKLNLTAFHFIIAGELGNEGLELRCARYFDTSSPLELNGDLFDKGMTKEQLLKYTQVFTDFKVGGQANGEQSGGSSGDFYYTKHVLAIRDDKKCSVLPLSFYYKPKPKLAPEVEVRKRLGVSNK
ncbi:hypothetical protein V1580_15220 [Enterobacter bugandensis]|uniref:hypothetical protein n=1 Tax=Enterobacter bugandensis TaxID=881260 RepID=UPI0037545E78